jgi:curved DNA-binding protein
VNRPSPDHYQTLCIPTHATHEEIRRAYRVLARRYHPDVNPGKASEERFKSIAEAYSVLSDPSSRAQYDAEYGSEHLKYHRAQSGSNDPRVRAYQQTQAKNEARRRYYETQQHVKATMAQAQSGVPPQRPSATTPPKVPPLFSKAFSLAKSLLVKQRGARKVTSKLSIVEISISLHEALLGGKKRVEIQEPEGIRKLSVTIPPGSLNGSIIRLRDRRGHGEEVVCILRVANHPTISIERKGVIVEIPITLSEARFGAQITLPTFDEPVIVKIPPHSKSGTELRVKAKGVTHKDGTRGDLIYRLLIQLPEAGTDLDEKIKNLETYYGRSPRNTSSKTILESL